MLSHWKQQAIRTTVQYWNLKMNEKNVFFSFKLFRVRAPDTPVSWSYALADERRASNWFRFIYIFFLTFCIECVRASDSLCQTANRVHSIACAIHTLAVCFGWTNSRRHHKHVNDFSFFFSSTYFIIRSDFKMHSLTVKISICSRQSAIFIHSSDEEPLCEKNHLMIILWPAFEYKTKPKFK